MSSSVIAIDGPVAVGKSTLGQLLALRLGYRFIDTGNMYRALTWLALERSMDPRDEAALSCLARGCRLRLVPSVDGDEGRVLVQGKDVTLELRNPQVEAAVSLVSEVAGVRRALVAKQKALARGGRVVMAGRDIGTVVLPRAQIKLYLTASPQTRAQRRQEELLAQGKEAPFEQVLADLLRRDGIDSARAHSPLKPAPDARVIDTEGLSLGEVLSQALALIQGEPCP